MDKYKQYIDVQWWNGVEKRDVENWIRNFGTDKELARLILDNIIFYNDLQIKAYTRFLINHLKNQVYMQVMKENQYSYIDDGVLEGEWKKYMDKTIFLPATLLSDTTSSAYEVLRHWRSVLRHDEDSFSSIDNIGINYEKGIRRLVLVDDFSGSGKQMLKVLGQKIKFRDKDIEVGRLSDKVEDIEITIAVYVIHEEAKKALSDKYPNIKVIYVDLISHDLNYLNENASMYEKIDIDKRRQMVREIKRINQEIMESDAEWKKLSSYVLNIPVVFKHGCPNNSLLLLFAHSNNWKQLFRRGEEI